jgi:hypothetical protein
MISAGYRVLGNFVGTGHTVGLTYDSNSDKFSFVGVEIPRSDGSFVNDPVVIDDLDPYINGFLKNGGYIRILPPG